MHHRQPNPEAFGTNTSEIAKERMHGRAVGRTCRGKHERPERRSCRGWRGTAGETVAAWADGVRERVARAQAGRRELRNDLDLEQPHLQMADRRSDGSEFPLLRPAAAIRTSLLRRSRAQELSASAQPHKSVLVFSTFAIITVRLADRDRWEFRRGGDTWLPHG